MTRLTDAQVAEAVAFITQAGAQPGPLPVIPEACRPASVADGYRIAEAMPGDTGARPEGWKAAVSSDAQLRDLGLTTPPVAPLFPGVIVNSPSDLDSSGYHRCIMEAEVAFWLSSGLPSRAAPYTMDEVRAAVGSAHLAIEAANVPFADVAGAGIPSLVAAGLAVGDLILGPAIDDWRARDLHALDWELLMDGEMMAGGLVGEARCDPLAVLLAMANDLSSRGIDLEPGQVVTTGAAATPTRAHSGQTTVARVAGIGEVVAAFV